MTAMTYLVLIGAFLTVFAGTAAGNAFYDVIMPSVVKWAFFRGHNSVHLEETDNLRPIDPVAEERRIGIKDPAE